MTQEFNAVEYLKKAPTRLLMKYHRSIHKLNGLKRNLYGVSEEECTLELTGDPNGTRWINLKQLKDELKTREHIPNKKEAKENRRNAATGKTHLLNKSV
jgi:hypothetical protein